MSDIVPMLRPDEVVDIRDVVTYPTLSPCCDQTKVVDIRDVTTWESFKHSA